MKARARNRFDETVIPDSAVEQRRCRESGAHPRSLTPRTVVRVSPLAEADALIASTASPRAMFDALTRIVARSLPLRAIAIVPCDGSESGLVWCADRREQSVAEAEAIALAPLAQVVAGDGRTPFSPLGGGALGRLRWIAVPLHGDDARVLGVLAVATRLGTNDEAVSQFVVDVARRLAVRMDREERERAPVPADELLAELEAILLDGLEYEQTLAQVARVVGTRVGTACIVDILGTSPSQIVHALSLPEQALVDTMQPLLDRAVGRCAPLTMDHSLVALAAAELGVAWIVVLPLSTREDVVGALAVLGPAERPLPFSPAQLDSLARHVASAIQNGQRYQAAVSGLRARDEILSTVSHDLKNPLSVILLSAARMLEEGPEARIIGGRPAAEVIHRSARRMRRLVSDLLDVAALDGGALTLHPSPQDATHFITETLEGLGAVAAEAGVTLHDDVPRVLPPVFVDADRIGQVLSNLVGNAIKFTPAGGSVRVRASTRDDALEISVSDTGIGISESELPHVFDRFWRAQGTRKLGTGLGLAISKAIVELSGGTIEAKSAPGVGTVMTFSVPLAHRLQLV